MTNIIITTGVDQYYSNPMQLFYDSSQNRRAGTDSGPVDSKHVLFASPGTHLPTWSPDGGKSWWVGTYGGSCVANALASGAVATLLATGLYSKYSLTTSLTDLLADLKNGASKSHLDAAASAATKCGLLNVAQSLTLAQKRG